LELTIIQGIQMDFSEPGLLGKTGLSVGRLGVGSGYGAPAAAYEEAFESGCNYFYWTLRRAGMRDAIKNICGQGKRDQLIIAIQSYSRSELLMEIFTKKALKSLGLNEVDIFLLGWHQRQPSRRVINKALQMKKKGYFRFLGMTGHNRPLFPQMARLGVFDLFHIRYNAAHRGAETEVFPFIPESNRQGTLGYTATRWGNLIDPKRTPKGLAVPRASDCYRFVLTQPQIDVCLTGPANRDQLTEAMTALDHGPMNDDELAWMRRVGDHIHAKSFGRG